MLRVAGELWFVSEGRPQLRVRLVCPGQEVLSAAGMRSAGTHLDARERRKQPLHAPAHHQSELLQTRAQRVTLKTFYKSVLFNVFYSLVPFPVFTFFCEYSRGR